MKRKNRLLVDYYTAAFTERRFIRVTKSVSVAIGIPMMLVITYDNSPDLIACATSEF